MGWIKAGDEYVTCRKCQRQSDARYVQVTGKEAIFYLSASVVRIIFQKHGTAKPMERPRRGSASAGPCGPITYQLDTRELETLKHRVWIKARDE